MDRSERKNEIKEGTKIRARRRKRGKSKSKGKRKRGGEEERVDRLVSL